MKHFLFILFLISNVAIACEDKVQIISDRLSIAASKIAGTKIKPKVKIDNRLDVSIFAIARTKSDTISINPNLVCDNSFTEEVKVMLIAHELGHFVAHIKDERIKNDAYSLDKKYSLYYHEYEADKYGKIILKQSGVKPINVAELCLKGYGNDHGCISIGIFVTH